VAVVIFDHLKKFKGWRSADRRYNILIEQLFNFGFDFGLL